LLVATAPAADVTLAWDAPRTPHVRGYKLYYGAEPGSYDGAIDVGTATTYTLTDLEEGQTYYFTVAAYDADGGESLFASEAAFSGFPGNGEGPAEDPAEELAELDNDATEAEVTEDEVIAGEADETPADASDERNSTPRTRSHVIPPSELKVLSVDSEPPHGDGAAEAAIDGEPSTFWHTELGPMAPVHPHELAVDLGEEYRVHGFRYLPRQDGNPDGAVARYSFYVSDDDREWGEPIATGTFTQSMVEQEVIFPEKTGRLVRFVAHSELDGRPWTSVAELTILGRR
jgi:hypothetical protein